MVVLRMVYFFKKIGYYKKNIIINVNIFSNNDAARETQTF